MVQNSACRHTVSLFEAAFTCNVLHVKTQRRRNCAIRCKIYMKSRRKSRILNLKNISTCSLAVWCFFVCSFPEIIFVILRYASGQFLMLFVLWPSTFVSINSTLNCLIFFWKNSILRREGMKIINGFRAHVMSCC